MKKLSCDVELAMKAVVDLLERVENADYIGEAVSQTQHALQAAYFAEQAGYDEVVILAALLHDVGHYCEPEPKTTMGALGVACHEQIGADYLHNLGFSAQLCTLVASHVDAKRYLAGKNPQYLARLSSASRGTLEYQGGPMGVAERKEFCQSAWFAQRIQVRIVDEKAKVVDLSVPSLNHYLSRLRANLLSLP